MSAADLWHEVEKAYLAWKVAHVEEAPYQDSADIRATVTGICPNCFGQFLPHQAMGSIYYSCTGCGAYVTDEDGEPFSGRAAEALFPDEVCPDCKKDVTCHSLSSMGWVCDSNGPQGGPEE